ARRTPAVAALVLSAVAAVSPFNVSTGRRADIGDLWIVPVGIVVTALFAWLPPWLDSRDRWVIDGEAVRWLGGVLFVAGSALRLWPVFVLGRRFSAVVAIQERHELATDGPYRWVRNPSYLGGLVGGLGWALVFRSVVGGLAGGLFFPGWVAALLLLPFLWLLVTRIHAEEALLASEFGPTYEAYRQ